MRRLTALLVSILLVLGTTCYGYCEDYAQSGEYYVYIGLKYMTNAVSSIEISCDDGFYYVQTGRNDFSVLQDLSSYSVINVSNVNGYAVAFDNSGNVLIDNIAGGYGLISANPDIDSRIIKIGGTSYRDGVCFGAYSSSSAYPGMLGVANYITLEHYIWGVVNSELGYYNPMEALKAQAIACRSFTLANLNKHGGGAISFDLCFRTHCQAYGGVGSEKEQTTQACKDTKGIVIGYDGDVACAYFHAYNGGYTMNSEDVWTASIGYLRAVRDEYTSVHNWSTSFSFEELREKLEASGRTIGTIYSVKVGQRLDNGAVNQLIFEGSEGKVYLNKNSIMDMLSLKSRWFSMGANDYLPAGLAEGTSNTQTVQENASMYVVSSGGTSKVDNNIYIVSEHEYSQNSIEGLVVYDGRSYTSLVVNSITQEISTAGTPSFTDEICSGGMIYLSGVGFGHGVGLCQTGMVNRANAGFTCEDIIKAYLTGAELIGHSSLGY